MTVRGWCIAISRQHARGHGGGQVRCLRACFQRIFQVYTGSESVALGSRQVGSNPNPDPCRALPSEWYCDLWAASRSDVNLGQHCQWHEHEA